MMTALIWIVVAVVIFAVIMQVVQLRRNVTIDLPAIWKAFDSVTKSQQALEQSVKADLAKTRDEATATARQARDEQGKALQELGATLQQALATAQSAVEQRLASLQKETAAGLAQLREDSQADAKQVAASLKGFQDTLVKQLGESGQAQKLQLDAVTARLDKVAAATDQKLVAVQTAVEARLKSAQEDHARQQDALRTAVGEQLQATEKRLGDSFRQVSERVGQVASQLTQRPG